MAALKQEDGDDLHVIGSVELVQTLIEHDLVDEFRVTIDPLVVGGGKRIFPADGVLRPLRLVDSQVTTMGMILATYAPPRGLIPPSAGRHMLARPEDGGRDRLSLEPTDGLGADADATNSHVGPIRQSVTVRSAPDRAFEVFTERMGTWWPVESYSRAVSELEHEHVEVTELEFQARMGGSVLEHLSDGRILPWGEVTDWHPPHRVSIAWRPHSLPEPPTEVEVTFAPTDGGTLVELEHRGWERLSDGFRAGLYEIYARGWPTTLARYKRAATSDS